MTSQKSDHLFLKESKHLKRQEILFVYTNEDITFDFLYFWLCYSTRDVTVSFNCTHYWSVRNHETVQNWSFFDFAGELKRGSCWSKQDIVKVAGWSLWFPPTLTKPSLLLLQMNVSTRSHSNPQTLTLHVNGTMHLQTVCCAPWMECLIKVLKVCVSCALSLLRYTKMKTATNIYIFNLALADSLFLATLPFQVWLYLSPTQTTKIFQTQA